MKRKSPISFPIVGDEVESSDIHVVVEERDDQDESSITTTTTTTTATATQIEAENHQPPPRVCTPSPPLSPRSWESCHEHDLATETFLRDKPSSSSSSLKSILRPSKKRRKLLHYRDTKELVDPVADESIATSYELSLFSHMVMDAKETPGFSCRLCSQPESRVACSSAESVEESLPLVEKHLRECKCSPSWLPSQLDKTKPLHEEERSPNKPYSLLLWKRLLAHSVYSKAEFPRKVTFAEYYQQRMIPGLERARPYPYKQSLQLRSHTLHRHRTLRTVR